MEMLFSLHIFPSLPNAAHTKPILRLTSSSHRPSSVINPPRQTNLVTCSSTPVPNRTCSSSCCFPIAIVLVFSAFIFSPILLLLLSTLFVRSYRFSFMSAIRSMSSAKRRLSSTLPLSFTPVPLPSFSANLITISSTRLNKSGDSPHPCLTPTLILNHSVNSPSIRTALMDLLYRSSINVTSSSDTPQYLITLHNPSCHTLSNACL